MLRDFFNDFVVFCSKEPSQHPLPPLTANVSGGGARRLELEGLAIGKTVVCRKKSKSSGELPGRPTLLYSKLKAKIFSFELALTLFQCGNFSFRLYRQLKNFIFLRLDNLPPQAHLRCVSGPYPWKAESPCLFIATKSATPRTRESVCLAIPPIAT